MNECLGPARTARAAKGRRKGRRAAVCLFVKGLSHSLQDVSCFVTELSVRCGGFALCSWVKALIWHVIVFFLYSVLGM